MTAVIPTIIHYQSVSPGPSNKKETWNEIYLHQKAKCKAETVIAWKYGIS